MIFNNAQIASVSFFWSKLPNLRIADCAIQQWRFWDCEVGGDVISSKLRWVNFVDGSVTLDFDNVRLDDVHAGGSIGLLNANYMYRILKKIYSNQGDDEISGGYYVSEREVDRKSIKEIPFSRWKNIGFWVDKIKYARMTLAFYYWRYGKSPHRVLFCSLLIILTSAGIYYFNCDKIASVRPTMNFIDCVYFSTMTFTTVGYGDFAPTGFLRIIASIESLLGVANFGFLVSGYTASKY